MKDQIQITQDNFIRLLEEEFPDKHTDVLHHIEENGEVLFHILCNDVIEPPLEGMFCFYLYNVALTSRNLHLLKKVTGKKELKCKTKCNTIG